MREEPEYTLLVACSGLLGHGKASKSISSEMIFNLAPSSSLYETAFSIFLPWLENFQSREESVPITRKSIFFVIPLAINPLFLLIRSSTWALFPAKKMPVKQKVLFSTETSAALSNGNLVESPSTIPLSRSQPVKSTSALCRFSLSSGVITPSLRISFTKAYSSLPG